MLWMSARCEACPQVGLHAMRWQIDDVRAVTVVASVDQLAVNAVCGFCEQAFEASWWVSLSVARDGVGGAVVDLCQACTRANWEGLLLRLEQVAEMLAAADVLRSQMGPQPSG